MSARFTVSICHRSGAEVRKHEAEITTRAEAVREIERALTEHMAEIFNDGRSELVVRLASRDFQAEGDARPVARTIKRRVRLPGEF